MSDISQEYSFDEDIAPYDDNMHDSDGFAAQSQEEYDDRAGEGPVDNDGYNGDGRSVCSSSDTGDMENYEVSSVVDLDPELQAIKDNVDRMVKTSGKTSTLKIRIPVSVDKRKHCTDKSPSSEAEDAPLKKKKSKSSTPTPVQQSRKGVEDDDTLPSIDTNQAKKQRGRPKNGKAAPAKKDFLVPVYLEIAQEPVLMRGKTHKGDKFVKQAPITDGPFHFTRKMTWDKFQKEVADIAGIDQENFGTISEGLKWSFQKKCPLPLKDEMGFKTLMLQVKGMKDPDSAIIIVSLPPLANRQSGNKACESEINALSDVQHDNGTIYGKKLNLDDQLAPIISMLEEAHPVGSCLAHSGIRCYVQQPQGWHFDINSMKLKVCVKPAAGYYDYIVGDFHPPASIGTSLTCYVQVLNRLVA